LKSKLQPQAPAGSFTKNSYQLFSLRSALDRFGCFVFFAFSSVERFIISSLD